MLDLATIFTEWKVLESAAYKQELLLRAVFEPIMKAKGYDSGYHIDNIDYHVADAEWNITMGHCMDANHHDYERISHADACDAGAAPRIKAEIAAAKAAEDAELLERVRLSDVAQFERLRRKLGK